MTGTRWRAGCARLVDGTVRHLVGVCRGEQMPGGRVGGKGFADEPNRIGAARRGLDVVDPGEVAGLRARRNAWSWAFRLARGLGVSTFETTPQPEG